jgi:hypothetical protein
MSSKVNALILRRKFAAWMELPSTNKPRILEWMARIRVFVKIRGWEGIGYEF